MVKTTLLLTLLLSNSFAQQASIELKKNCLNCHVEQKIPSELMYRRYLNKYSTHNRIKKRLFDYLKKPHQKDSIMPKQFFLKFPQKVALDLNETALIENIEAYLDFFDVKKKLVLP